MMYVYNSGSVDNQRIAAAAIIGDSRVMRKVILDGKILDGQDCDRDQKDLDGLVKYIVPSCKKANVELWNENFEAGNGKVNLDSELL
jgi:hypothetical protein